MKVIDDELNKAKCKAFGKVKIRNKPKGNKELENLQKKKNNIVMQNASNAEEEIGKVDQKFTENLLIEQRNNFDKEIEALKDLKFKKGKSASIFALKNKVVGKKKIEQEATIIKNPVNKQEVTDPEEINQVSLNYCTVLLTNREPKDKFKDDVELKRVVYAKRMNEVIEEDIDFSTDIFEKSLKAIKQKKGNKYDFIL